MDKEQIDKERLYAIRIRLTSQNFLNEMSEKKELLNRFRAWK